MVNLLFSEQKSRNVCISEHMAIQRGRHCGRPEFQSQFPHLAPGSKSSRHDGTPSPGCPPFCPQLLHLTVLCAPYNSSSTWQPEGSFRNVNQNMPLLSSSLPHTFTALRIQSGLLTTSCNTFHDLASASAGPTPPHSMGSLTFCLSRFCLGAFAFAVFVDQAALYPSRHGFFL